MHVFVKRFSDYKTIKKASVISYALVLDSLERESSTVTVSGNAIDLSDAGNWLVYNGLVCLISGVNPQDDQTVLTLENPLDAFQRAVELGVQPSGQTIGGFIASQLRSQWVNCDDPAYAVPYLTVSNSDTTPYVPPELDSSGSYTLPAYVRLMRKTYRTEIRFEDATNQLKCLIQNAPAANRQISFNDGHSRLQSVAYSSSGLAKVTALHDIDTGEKDADGNTIYERERTQWYLSEDGSISQLIPARRASGEWGVVQVKGTEDVRTKVEEAFAKNRTSHKLEFWSDRDLPVQTICTFLVYGKLLRSHISCKRKSSADNRFYYKSGELATTATEKLKGVLK